MYLRICLHLSGDQRKIHGATLSLKMRKAGGLLIASPLRKIVSRPRIKLPSLRHLENLERSMQNLFQPKAQ